METSDGLQQTIQRLLPAHQKEVANLTTKLWEALAFELTSIIGDTGFAMLYARSLHLTQSKFPWLAASQTSQPTSSPFISLKASLEERLSTEANEASRTLLAIFTNLLAGLIGEPLTISILHSAWGDDNASDITSEEPSS
jgi:hypothetical protein